jgi:8-oxo-dGTP pyrophosphatase MutT (NUDIX family)
MGAGLLPVALFKGSIFILLGQERHNNLWCDFGGSKEKGETNFQNAMREGEEELNGFLGTDKDFYDLVNNNLILSIDYDKYTSYLFKVNYDINMPIYFNNINNFAEKHLDDKVNKLYNGLFEKKYIDWYSLESFKNEKNKKLIRKHYLPHINSIIKNEELIKNTIYNKNNNK